MSLIQTHFFRLSVDIVYVFITFLHHQFTIIIIITAAINILSEGGRQPVSFSKKKKKKHFDIPLPLFYLKSYISPVVNYNRFQVILTTNYKLQAYILFAVKELFRTSIVFIVLKKVWFDCYLQLFSSNTKN